MKLTRFFTAAAFSLLGAGSVGAQVNVAVPTNAFITRGGFDWAWAAPVSPDNVILTFQSQFGWRLPTAAELLAAPLATDFLFAGANVPFGGSDAFGNSFEFTDNSNFAGDGACAAAFFNSRSYCDYGNAPGSNGDNPLPWNGTSFPSESLVIRTAATVVPEPASFALVAAGLVATFGVARRKRLV